MHDGLESGREPIALAMLTLPDAIRGFGPVKADAMAEAEVRREALRADFVRPWPVDLTRAA